MNENIDEFQVWSEAIMSEAEYQGAEVPDVDGRIARLQELWRQPVSTSWLRGQDDVMWKDHRDRRGGGGATPNPGEWQLEHAVLVQCFDRVRCFGDRLVDGINAVPLARHSRGVEADMLLLLQGAGGYRQFLVEAKIDQNNAWYAVVENLRQLALFRAGSSAREMFHRRDETVPKEVPAAGLVLAPEDFYTAKGQKAKSLAPARKLIAALGVEIALGVWRGDDFTIQVLELGS